MRAWHSYQKMRRLVGWLLRNRGFQSRRAGLSDRHYLHVGCGPQIAPGFVNLDYRWVPGVDVVWDLARPLPFPANRFRGVFSEHCLEHFDLAELAGILTEIHRVLEPGGRVRLVVPSLEIHARTYLAARDKTPGSREDGPAREINRVFYSGHDRMQNLRWRNEGHQFIHDEASLGRLLDAAGFTSVTPAACGQGVDPALVIDRADRAPESLYLEAVKPSPPSRS